MYKNKNASFRVELCGVKYAVSPKMYMRKLHQLVSLYVWLYTLLDQSVSTLGNVLNSTGICPEILGNFKIQNQIYFKKCTE